MSLLGKYVPCHTVLRVLDGKLWWVNQSRFVDTVQIQWLSYSRQIVVYREQPIDPRDAPLQILEI